MPGQWKTVAVKAGIDAYVDWLRGPGKKYPPPYEEKSILVCLEPGKTVGEFRSRCEAVRRRDPSVKIPMLSGDAELEHFTAIAEDDFLDTLEKHTSLWECIHRVIVAQK